jgi:uncharacterized protein YggE
MRYRILQATLAGLLAGGLLPSAALAQYGSMGGPVAGSGAGEAVSGVGSAMVERPPAALRMHVELLGKGKTLKEALEKLAEHRQAAELQLKALKADPGSIKLGRLTRSGVASQQRRQFEAMVMQRFSARGRELPEGLKMPVSFTVSMPLTAEWPLEAGSPEQMLLAAQSLQDKVKAADLGGTKEAESLSPEEQELAEEMSEMMSRSGQEGIKPGEPYFFYVARISDEDRDKAFAEAFAKAREQASRLARAAGARLGPLVALSGQGSGSANYGDAAFDYETQQYIRRLAAQRGLSTGGDNPNETVAANPGSLMFMFSVRAMFRLQQERVSPE